MSLFSPSVGKSAVSPLAAFALCLGLAGCPFGGNSPDPGSVTAMTVTGTDGQASDPAQAVPTQNLGNFSVFFNVADLSRSAPRATLLVRAPASGEEVQLFSECCSGNDSNCTNQTVSCQYTNAGTVTCGGNAPVSLTQFFQRNGGIPNTAQLELRSTTLQCSSGILHEQSMQTFTALRGIVFR